jgi:hypothetical protein
MLEHVPFWASAFEVKKPIISFKKFKFSIKNAESFWRFQICGMGEKRSEEVTGKKIRAKKEKLKKLRNGLHTTFLKAFLHLQRIWNRHNILRFVWVIFAFLVRACWKSGSFSGILQKGNLFISVADPGCLSRIPDPDYYPSRIPDPKKQQQNFFLSYLFL